MRALLTLAALIVVAGCASIDSTAPSQPRADAPDATTGSRLPKR